MNVLNTGRLIQVGRNTGVSGFANLNGGTVTTPAIRGNSGNGVGYAIVPSATSGTGLGNYNQPGRNPPSKTTRFIFSDILRLTL